MRSAITYLTLIIISLTDCAVAQQVMNVVFSGKFRVKEGILLNEIDMKNGCPFSEEQWALDQKRLASLAIFSEILSDTVSTPGGIAVHYYLREVWTLIPRLDIGGEIDKIDIDVGLSDKDFLGLYLEPGILYSHFESRDSYRAWLSYPRAFGTRNSAGVSWSRTHTLEPADIRGEVYRYGYDVRRTTIRGVAGKRISERLMCVIGLSFQNECYRIKPYAVEPRTLPDSLRQKKIRLSGGVTLGRVYYNNFFFDGRALTMGGDLIALDREGYKPKHWLLYLEASNYTDIRTIWNICSRVFFGTSGTNEILPPYAITGLSNVRGAEDRIRRGDNVYFANGEVRLKVYQDKWFHGQLVVFVDVGDAWEDELSSREIADESYVTTGFGVRLGHRRFYNAIGRVDFAYNTNNSAWTVYISAGQFF
jgi:outer membrane protein assembly factor BamA